MSTLETAVQMIRNGTPGEEVMTMLREKCSTVKAMSCVITRIRAALMEQLPIPDCDAALLPFADEPGVASFLQLPLSERVRIQREHRSLPTWSDGAETALASLQLLPQNLAMVKLTQPELVQLARKREAGLIKKQETLLHVPRAGEWLKYAIALARQSTPDMSFARLALPLLLLSGRRSTEILNGKSAFVPTVRETTVVFTGAIKKRGAATSWEIPLLCDYATFANALSVLRQKQGYAQCSPSVCNNRYQKNLNAAVSTLFPWAASAHQLRSVYASCMYHLYSCDTTFNLAAMRALGHEALTVSLSYNATVLHDMDAWPVGCLGPLP